MKRHLLHALGKNNQVYLEGIISLRHVFSHVRAPRGHLVFLYDRETTGHCITFLHVVAPKRAYYHGFIFFHLKGSHQGISSHCLHWKGTASCFLKQRGTLQGTALHFLHWKGYPRRHFITFSLIYWQPIRHFIMFSCTQRHPIEHLTTSSCTYGHPKVFHHVFLHVVAPLGHYIYIFSI